MSAESNEIPGHFYRKINFYSKIYRCFYCGVEKDCRKPFNPKYSLNGVELVTEPKCKGGER